MVGFDISDNLQLAKTMKMEKILFPARAERKIDGVRMILFNGKFYTRTGKLVPLAPPVIKDKQFNLDPLAAAEDTII